MRLGGITKGENIKKNVSQIEPETFLSYEALEPTKETERT